MNDSLFASAGGFDILPVPGGFQCVDTCTINNWGAAGPVHASREAAEDYAYRCNDFKRGHRMTVDLQPWESLTSGRYRRRC